jgi:hypothetical protein
MLWTLVDVLGVIAAFALLLLVGPEVIGLRKWRQRLLRRQDDQANAGPPAQKP